MRPLAGSTADLHRHRDVVLRLLVAHVRDAAADQQRALARLRIRRRTRLPLESPPPCARSPRAHADRSGARGGTPPDPRRAAAAISSVKLSTANTFAILPGARRFDGLQRRVPQPVHEHAHVRGGVGRIAVLRDRAGAGRAPARCPARSAASSARAPRRLRRQPHLRVPRRDAAVASTPPLQVEQLLRALWDPSRARPGATTARAPARRRLREQHRVGGG